MTAGKNRFEDFFVDGSYIALKNLLYNYRLRKRAVNRSLQGLGGGWILEVGSGLSPIVEASGRVVYSELSFGALKTLRETLPGGLFVVADAALLPFKPSSFQHVVCSEVLEHLPDDRQALRQIVEVMESGASLLLTFPHRQGYFAVDDRFVNHLRRYELAEMEKRLWEAGLHPVDVRKVLGPLEKGTMMLVTAVALMGRHLQPGEGKVKSGQQNKSGLWRVAIPIFGFLNLLFCLPVWFDAWLMPRSWSAVLLIRSVKQ